MIEENQDFNLETDHLEEVIESPPPAQPVVVIQYRTRGVPWYLVLPLLVLVPLGAVAVYHRVSSRVRYPLVPPPSADQSTRKAAERQAVPGALSEASVSAALQGLPSASIGDWGAPLALNSQPIAPGSLPAVLPAPAPAAKADLTKPASPAAATPAATKEGEPSKSAGSSDLAKAAARCHGRQYSATRDDSCEGAWASGRRHHSRGRDPPRPSRDRGDRLLGAGR